LRDFSIDIILEVKGKNGVLRIDLKEDEIQKLTEQSTAKAIDHD